MMSSTVYLIYIVWFFARGECTCTFPYTGSWHSSNYDNMVFSGSGLYISGLTFARTSIVGSGWECYSNTGNTYVVKTNSTITLSAGGSLFYAYTCFIFTSVNTYSYYYYQNTPVESLLKNERVIAYQTGSTVTSGDVCKDTPSAAEYNVMVQSGQETNAKTNIGEVMFANFHYKYNDGVTDRCGIGTSDSMLTICTDRQTLTFDYAVCSDVMMYSTGGVLGSVATIESGTTYYTTVYNYDATVDGVNTFRFTCIASAASGNQVSATINPKSCIAGQTPTSRPSNGGIFTMVANSTCEITTTTTSTTTTTTTTTPTTTTTTTTVPTTTTSTNLTFTLSNIPALTATVDNVDVAAIVGGVIGGVLFIVIVVIIILLCIRHHKIKRRKQEVIDRRMRIWKIRSNEDDFYGDEVPLNETSMNLDCSQTIIPEPSLVKSPSIVTKLSQKRRKDSETDSRITQLGNALENPIGETSLQVETHRNREKIPEMLTFPKKRTENMPWKTGGRAGKKGYSSESGYPSMSKFGSLTSRSYTTLKTPRSNMSSRLEDAFLKNGAYSRSDLNLNRSLTATHQFKSDTNIYAKAKSLTEKSLARELTAIKEVPRKETPNYMKPIRSKTAMSINKERAKSRHSMSRHFDSKSRVSLTRNESRMTHQKDTLSGITRASRKTMTPREQVMSRAKSKAMKENPKTWRISEKIMPNPKPADEKSFVESLRANNAPSQKKKKKPRKVVVKKLKTPYGVVHVDASQKRAVSMMSLNQLAGLVQTKKRKLPTRSQVDVHRETTVVLNPREEQEEVKETDAQKGALEFMESEYTWMTSNPKTEEPTKDTTPTHTDKGVTKVTKTKRVGSEDSGFSDNHSPPANTRDQTEELELINILPPKRPPKFFKNISDRAKTAKSRNPSWK